MWKPVWFLYDNSLGHERVKGRFKCPIDIVCCSYLFEKVVKLGTCQARNLLSQS